MNANPLSRSGEDLDVVIVGAGLRRPVHAAPRCAASACRPASSRPATASAAPGTGTATPARAATSRAWTTPTPSPTSSSRSGSGPSATPPSPRSCATLNHVADRFDLRRDIQFDTRVAAAAYDEAAGRWTVAHRRRRRGDRAGSSSWPPAACRRRTCPTSPGLDRFARRDLPHRALAARGRRLHRQAGRRDRHRLVGHPGDPDHRRAGRAAHRLPAHRRLHAAGRATTRSTRREQAAIKADYAGFRAGTTAMPAAGDSRFPANAGARSSTPRRRSAKQPSSARWTRGGLGFLGAFDDLLIDQEANDTAAEFVRGKIREIVKRPGGRRHCCRRGTSSAASGSASTPATSRPSTGPTSPRRRARRRRSSAITPAGMRTGGRRATSSTSSSSPPASTR